jgi:hypothetical protein
VDAQRAHQDQLAGIVSQIRNGLRHHHQQQFVATTTN